jgi:hypothetical protein
MAADAAEELERLHDKRQREGLTDSEAQAAAALTRQYERIMLVRAEAAALLMDRGRDVSAGTAPGAPGSPPPCGSRAGGEQRRPSV